MVAWIQPRKIIDQVEPHAHWHIIMMISAFLLQIAGIDAQLLWSVMLPALINPPKVQQYVSRRILARTPAFVPLHICVWVFRNHDAPMRRTNVQIPQRVSPKPAYIAIR